LTHYQSGQQTINYQLKSRLVLVNKIIMINIEAERVEAVKLFLQLGFDKIRELQDIVNLASQLCEKPVALITLLDEDVNWLKVRKGVDEGTMPRETSFCQYSIQQEGLLIVPDASSDERFENNPLVHHSPKVRFYAGAPLTLRNGLKMGTLCLFDLKPNHLTSMQQETLMILSRQVTYIMELELGQLLLKQHIEEIERQNESFRKIAQIQSHQVRQPLTSIMAIINLIKLDDYVADKETLMMMEKSAQILDSRIHEIVKETRMQNSKVHGT